MPLTWDITKCADGALIKTDAEWPVTEACIFLTVGIGIGEWTEANAAEVYGRVHLMEAIYGAMVRTMPAKAEKGARPVDRFLTPEDIRRRIGLRTNVGKPETRASFLKRHCAAVVDDAAYQYQRAERARLKAIEDAADAEITAEGRALAATGTV